MTTKTKHTRTYGLMKAVLREKFIAMSVYIKKSERSQIKNLSMHLKVFEKQKQAYPQTNKRK
jgi:hypothetical protein